MYHTICSVDLHFVGTQETVGKGKASQADHGDGRWKSAGGPGCQRMVRYLALVRPSVAAVEFIFQQDSVAASEFLRIRPGWLLFHTKGLRHHDKG